MKTKVFLASAALVIVFALIAGWSPHKDVSAFSFLGLFLTVPVGVHY